MSSPPPLIAHPTYVKEHENDKDLPARMTAVASLRNDKLFSSQPSSRPRNSHNKRGKKGNK
jgi:hypothetical protein